MSKKRPVRTEPRSGKSRQELRALAQQLESLKVSPSGRPRSAARETWDVGFNDALDEVLALIDERLRA
jgi:hypothetical protein